MASCRSKFLWHIWETFILIQCILSAAHSIYTRVIHSLPKNHCHLRDPKICGKPVCSGANQKKLNFEPGLKYLYNYNMTIDTFFDVARSNTSRLNITTTISVEFNTPCEATLKIIHANIMEGYQNNMYGRSSEVFSDPLSEHSFRFYFEDGNIKEVCPHKNETSWVVNFKKGILSSLQNTMKRMDTDYHTTELDVNGKCMTDYKLEELSGTTLIISKKKDIFSCVNRAQLHSFIPTSSYIFQNRNHKWTPLESNNFCSQYVDHKIITKVTCEERHSFLPLYNQKNGATTVLRFQLELIEEMSSTHTEIEENRNQGVVHRRESLLYDHRKTPKAVGGELKESKDLITTLCTLNSEEFQPDSAEVFNKLIHRARHLPYSTLSQLFKDSVTLCPSGKKHMIDALPHLRSSAAISVMTDVLMQTILPHSIANEFLLAISLHSRPDESTISAVTPLLLKPIKEIELNIMLTVSSLIHSFCMSSSGCEKNENIVAMIAHIENVIDNIYQSKEDLQKIMIALKAIGNAGVLTSGLISKLQGCIQNPSLPLDIRVAAIEAHRRLPCDADKDFLLNIFMNQTFDTELRITAYLQIMKCPSYYVMKGVRHALKIEEVNQVLSFVWSHLENQKKSSMPNRVEIQSMLQDQELKTKFSSDVRKFSRNYEHSFFLNDYGIGGFLVYDIIFSHKTYIPSTIRANITINIFGESVNLAEVTLNLQGFEQYVEKLFWHEGIFSKSKVETLLRLLRSLPMNLNDQVDRIPNFIRKDFIFPKASLSMKFFGNEVKYMVIAGKDDLNNAAKNFNPLTIIKNFLSGQQIDVEKSLMFIDVRYIAPLSVGLPLIMDAVGTTTIKLNMAGFFNSTAFSADGQLDIDGKLKPSIAVNTVGTMGVDAYSAETSIKLHNKIFTSTAMEGRLKMKGYKFISVALNLPLKKSEIFSMENQLIVMNSKQEITLHGITPGRVEDQICSWPLLDDIFGLQLCTSYLLPNTSLLFESPLLIFTSPVKVRIFLEKSDPSTKKYSFEYKMYELENETLLSVKFETPESNTKRSLKATVHLDNTVQNFTLLFQSASNEIKAQGFYLNTLEEKSLNFLLDINGKNHVDIQLALYTKEGKYGYTYEPKLLFQINNKRVADLSGSYKWVDKNSISQCEINLNFRTNKFTTNIKGYVRTNDASVATNIKMEYQFDNGEPIVKDYLRFELVVGDRSIKQLIKYYGNLLILSSAYPQINLVTSVNYQRAEGHLDCKIVLASNPEVNDEKKKLNIELALNFHKTLLGSKTNLILEIVKPDNLVDIKFVLSHQISRSISESTAIIRYAVDKEIKIKLNITNPKGSLIYLEGKLEVELPVDLKPMILITHIHEKIANEFDIDFMGTWFSGHTLSIKGIYQDRSTLGVTSHNIKLIAKSQLFYDIVINGRLLLSEEEYKVDLQAEHNSVKYAIILNHLTSPGMFLQTYGEIQHDHSSYVVTNFIDLVNQHIRIELHLDQYRDIHISLRGIHNSTQTNAGFDICWDVNRDPTQRIVLTGESLTKGYLNYEGKFIIEYPGRVITALLELNQRDIDYMGTAKLEWSQTEKINIVLFAVYDLMERGIISFRSKITTPLENWQSTSLNYGLWLLENSIRSNASINWQEHQSVHLHLSCNYKISDELLDLSFKTILNSTISEINSMHTILHHVLSNTHFDSGVIIQSAPGHIVSIQSAGHALRDTTLIRYSGYIDVSIPYNNWTGGHLSCNASLDKHHTFFSDFKIILNERQFTSSLKGTMKTLNESRVVIYFTTPYEKYKKIVGRFIFSASKKHIVADIKGPPPLEFGIEVKYVYENLSNFDLALHAMTGVIFANKILIVGQRNVKLVDFRTGWNTVMIGITGKSFYDSWDNFEYKGILYTPFEGFKESGAIVKFSHRPIDSIEFEARASVAQYKMGFKFQATNWRKSDIGFVLPENTSILFPLQADINENPSYNLIGLFELDTIIYSTMSGNINVIRQNNVYYLTGDLLLPYLEIDIEDELNIIDIVQLSNHFSMRTNNSLLSELKSRLEISGLHTSTLLIKLDAEAFSNNQTLDFDMETVYIFKQNGQDSGAEGMYKVNHKLRTPFEFLDHLYLDFNLQNQNHAYSTNLTLDIKDVRVIIDGSLDVSVEGNYFFIHTEMSIFSPVFMLPVLKLSLTKDFNEVENKLLVSVHYSIGTEIESAPINSYVAGGTWHIGGDNLFKLSGYILTPHPKLDELRVNVHYSHDDQEEQLYFLETFFKYSSEIEVKLRGNVDGSHLVLHIESPNENFRIIEVYGILRKHEGGYFTIESTLSTDSVITMQGTITTSNDIPLFMNLNLYHRDTRQQLVGLSMKVQKKLLESSKRYDMLFLVRYDNLNINVEGDLSTSPEEKLCKVIVTSNHPDYNKVHLILHIFPKRDFSSMVQLNGSTNLKFLVTEFNVMCSHWFKGNEGYLKVDLDSTQVNGKSYLAWTLDYLHTMRGFANATYSYQNISKDFSSQLFLLSPNASLDNIFIGADFSTSNKNWWFNSNVSLLAPTLSNIAFTSHLRLPHDVQEVHTLVGKLHYTQDMMYLSQMLNYSTFTSDTGFKTLAEMNRTEDSIDGEIFLMTGNNSSLFLHDTLTAKKKNLNYQLTNVLKSSFIKDDLTLKILYEKPSTNHLLKVYLFYPKLVTVADAYVSYNSINNLYGTLNCTVPFSNLPSIAAYIKTVTNYFQYQRHGQMKWHNNTALFNYTHTKSIFNPSEQRQSNITDGIFIVDFPLTTRHIGQVTYSYEDLENWSSGFSKMVYNEEEILRGNFTYRTDTSELTKKDDISVHVNNKYVPLGLKYFSESNEGTAHAFSDTKRAEIFNLANSTEFNVTGEVTINKSLTEDVLMFKVLHANTNRSLTVDTVKSQNNTLKSYANLFLKPNLWFNSILYIVTKENASAYGNEADLFLSYPKRDFVVHGGYIWSHDQLISELSICPNKLLGDNKMVGAVLNWRRSQLDTERQYTSIIISHPSFEKNLTFIGEIKLNDWALLNINSSLEYVRDRKRKVSFSGWFENKKADLGREYSVNLFANHPVSRLNLDFKSHLSIGQVGFDFQKNITYTRSYLPLQFWISKVKLDNIRQIVELESRSLRELILVNVDYAKEGPLYKINGSVIKGPHDKITGHFYVNLDDADSRLIVNFTPGASEQLEMHARYIDNRHTFLNIWRVYEEILVPEFTFDLKLNHSQLLFGTLSWRPQIKNEIAETVQSSAKLTWSYIVDSAEFWTEYVKSETIESVKDIWLDAKPVVQDFLDDMRNVDMLKEDIEYFRKIFNESYNANEFYMQDIYNIYLLLAEEIAFKDKMGSLPKIVNELWNIMGETGETIRQSILWMTETLKRAYAKFLDFFSKFMSGETTQQLSQTLSNIVEKYDKMIKDLHVSFIHYIESLWDQAAEYLTNYWAKCIQVIEPTFIEIVHYIETVFWTGSKQVIAFMYQKQNQFLNSPYFSKESNISQDLDKFYKDLTKKDFFSNLGKYISIILGVVKEKYFAVVPFGYELNEVASEIYNEIKVLYKLPAISFVIDTSHKLYLKVIWVSEYFQIGNKIQKAIPIVYHQITELSHNALENEMKNHEAKTKFIFDPETGYIHLEQKLPIPWYAFNQTPNFAEIPEYKMLSNIQSWFSPSNMSFMNFYYKYCSLLEPSKWLPPFKGQAIIIKNKHFISFDRKYSSYSGPCSYLLAKDFINNDFSLVLKSDPVRPGHHSIALLIGQNIIEIDLIYDMLKSQDGLMNSPANLNGTYVFMETNIITVTREDQFTLRCNLKYDVCTFDVSGWYFGKTAGLLGTMDNEPSNDILSSRGEMETDINKFMESWALEASNCTSSVSDLHHKTQIDITVHEECNSLFASRTSQFSICFQLVDPFPFNKLCHMSTNVDNEVCTSAVSYVQACLAQNIPLRIPYSCVKCQFENGTSFDEGNFIKVMSGSEPHSADIVFIVEAKECNRQISMKKHIPAFISILTKELQEVGVKNNRFSVVIFGGDGVFNSPNNILIRNQAFTNSKVILDVFKNIPTGNGDADIFGALKYATKMQFRLGVSKIFILFPCSSCDITNMTVDYSVLNDVLRERAITLHILMNNDFGLGKARISKIFYGLDVEAAYTKNDFKAFKGDRDLLRQVKITKSMLGYCTPLALDTNGTLFTAKKLDNTSGNAAKKFLNVFAKRVAKTATPPPCQMCECSGDDNGIDYTECFTCDTPLPSIIDFGSNSTFHFLQSFDQSNSEMDMSL